MTSRFNESNKCWIRLHQALRVVVFAVSPHTLPRQDDSTIKIRLQPHNDDRVDD